MTTAASGVQNDTCVAVILAAGKSTRMCSKLPKPVHKLCGLPLTRHVVDACRSAGVSRVIVVVGHEADQVKAALGPDCEYAIQHLQRGSADAVMAALPLLSGHTGTVLVLAGDVPLLQGQTIRTLVDTQNNTSAPAVLLTAHLDDPTGYGRIVRNIDGSVARIVEHKDATETERAITEWNPSIYCFEAASLCKAIHEVKPNNSQGEYYLTDVIGILASAGQRVEAVACGDAREAMGVNNRVELAEAAAILRERTLHMHMLAGVSVIDPANTYVDVHVTIGQDTVLEPGTHLCGTTRIGEDCTIGPNSRIVDSAIGDRCLVLNSYVSRCRIGDDARIGPFANLRPGCELGNQVRIGDYVELKNSRLGDRVSASHLAYVGDADVGADTNIGAGVVVCNYDGRAKHRTTVGAGAFIGSNSTLIAPVEIGDCAVVAAASVITDEVPGGSLAIARSRQTVKPGWAARRAAKEESCASDG